MSQGKRCPGCRQGRLISRALGFRECTNVECYYTTAGQPEHDPEPSPGPEIVLFPRWHSTTNNIAAIGRRNLDIAEGRVKPEQSCSDCGGEMVQRRIRGTEMSVPFCEQCQCPTKPGRTCPQCDVGRLHTSGYIEGQAVCFECGFRAMGLAESQQIALERGRTRRDWECPQCGNEVCSVSVGIPVLECSCGFRAMGVDPGMTQLDPAQDKGAAIEKLNRELLACDEMDRAMPGLNMRKRLGSDAVRGMLRPWDEHAPEPDPEATELERLRCLVKALEDEAQGLRERVRELEKCRGLLDDACNEWERVVGEVASHRDRWRTEGFRLAGELAAEKERHLDAKLALVKATAELKALREKHGVPEMGPQPERAESRLGDVPGFVFQRGPAITCGEED